MSTPESQLAIPDTLVACCRSRALNVSRGRPRRPRSEGSGFGHGSDLRGNASGV